MSSGIAVSLSHSQIYTTSFIREGSQQGYILMLIKSEGLPKCLMPHIQIPFEFDFTYSNDKLSIQLLPGVWSICMLRGKHSHWSPLRDSLIKKRQRVNSHHNPTPIVYKGNISYALMWLGHSPFFKRYLFSSVLIR